ncbi:DUF4148 domain-containing protein [Aquabacterium humicola]|uniref:DUF4148 domain-containing protein n=1 Tax=Aquabacterium humicola TaxID=3237377 RepID=UPI0025427C37|nr:DUF4148 domain-containing protein [Rubrivivax pictus]
MQTRSLLIAAAVAFASGAALADDPTIDTTPFQSTMTRAQVKADVQVAHALHQLQPAGERDAAPSVVPTYAVARSAVKAEVLAARAAGTLLPAGEVFDGTTRGRAVQRAVDSSNVARR